jgi:hypothetical protein
MLVSTMSASENREGEGTCDTVKPCPIIRWFTVSTTGGLHVEQNHLLFVVKMESSTGGTWQC